MDADRIQRIFDGVNDAEDANRTGEGAWVGDDIIGRRGDPVAAGSGHAAHGNHHRFTRGFCCRQLFTNHFRGADAAARAVDAQNNRFHLRIEAGIANLRGGGVSPDVTRRLFAVHDRAVSEDHRNGGALLGRRFHAVIVIADGAIVIIRFAPAELFSQRLLHVGGGAQLINQLVVQRVLRRIAIHFTQTINQPLSAREQLLSRDLAVSGDGIEVVLP